VIMKAKVTAYPAEIFHRVSLANSESFMKFKALSV